MSEDTVTAAPARKRAASAAGTGTTATPRKTAPRKAAAKAPVVVKSVGDDNRERYQFAMVHAGDTKTYAKFQPPAGSGCVGTLYAPLGTKEIKVLMIGGPAE